MTRSDALVTYRWEIAPHWEQEHHVEIAVAQVGADGSVLVRSLTAVTGSITVIAQNTVALYLALGLAAFVPAIEVTLLVLYVSPRDHKDLLKFHRAWRGR